MKEEETKSRREFVKGSVLSGLGALSLGENPFSTLLEEDVTETGEMVKLLSDDGDIIEIDKAYLKPVPESPPIQTDIRNGVPGKKFVMVIDLSRCKNLKRCQASCNKMHFVPEGQNWVKIYPMQESANTSPYWQPTICMHCDEPPCVKVCPVDATFKRTDGLVLIDNERCIGCRFCMAACPYSVRVFNWDEPELPEEANNIDEIDSGSSLPKIGTVDKCDFCPHMAREGKLPHCVDACPNGVFFFGDINEDTVTNGAETFRFSQLIKDKAGYRLMEDLGTKPRVYYLPPVNRLFPFEEGLEKEETKSDNGN